jgi:hypothetical protein
MSNLEMALTLAGRGWYVFPCKPDKSPFTAHGMKDSSMDEGIIKAWWERWPGALVGISCQASGFFALDIDTKNNVDGWRSFTELITTHGRGVDIDYGPAQETLSNGLHLLFKYPDGLDVPNNAGKLGAGLDLRSRGYICTGSGYSWLDGHGPDCPLTDAPGWLLDLIREMSKPKQISTAPTVGSMAGAGEYWKEYFLSRASVGNRNESGFGLACQLRDSGLSESEAEQVMSAFAAGVPAGYSEREALASLRQAFQGARREPAHLPGLAGPGELGGVVQVGNPDRKTRWTVDELFNTDFPEPTWIAKNILPVGLAILSGRPKLGKSWMALQLAHSTGTGGVFLGEKVDAGAVLYLALEDPPRRLKDRAIKQGIPRGAAITFVMEWKPFTHGGLADLEVEIAKGKYTLIIIDTFSRAVGGADQLDLATMTNIMGQLQGMASHNGIGILLIDHHRKNAGIAANVIDDVLGSTGKAAIADCLMGLYREQGKHGATLKIIGREVEELELSLSWDGLLFCWQNLGDAGKVRADTTKADVLRALAELDEMGELPTTTRIARHADCDKGNASRALAELVSQGLARRGERVGREIPYLPIEVKQQ